MDPITLIILFIVIYLLWMILRWFVLPHMKIFPYIPPQFIWTTAYGAVVYAATAVFHWILMALAIIYILWIIIKNYVPNFPIPFKTILLNMPPFKPLEDAGVLPFIDRLVDILLSSDRFGTRIRNAANAFADFVKGSVSFIFSNAPMPKRQGSSAPSGAGADTGGDGEAVASGEKQQIEDENDRCIEENTKVLPRDASGTERAKAMVENQKMRIDCRLKTLQAYTNLMNYRDFL